MDFFDEMGWLAVGGYHVAEDALNKHALKKNADLASALIRNLSDETFEKKIREFIYNASEEEFNEIWCRIEEHKRDNPHLIRQHLWSSYWGHVGKERFPFTYTQFFLQTGKKKLTKADQKMLATYRGWTVTLLMNTYGKYSVMEATRVAFRDIYGTGRGDWTREFG